LDKILLQNLIVNSVIILGCDYNNTVSILI